MKTRGSAPSVDGMKPDSFLYEEFQETERQRETGEAERGAIRHQKQTWRESDGGARTDTMHFQDVFRMFNAFVVGCSYLIYRAHFRLKRKTPQKPSEEDLRLCVYICLHWIFPDCEWIIRVGG